MAFKLSGFGKGKKTNIKEGMDRKYGTGEHSRGGKKFEERMKPGESKFNYDVRMRKVKRGTESTSSTKSSSTYRELDPKSEIHVKQDKTLPYDFQPQERNPGDLREQARFTSSTLPSAPGDDWTYKIFQDETGESRLKAIDKHGKHHSVEPGSKSDKAIRERYTGSETGDLSSWYGHDTYGSTESYDWDPTLSTEERSKMFDESWSTTEFEKKSYLPYDLAQKQYNPKYKGSKK